jgi:hypothetical protein
MAKIYGKLPTSKAEPAMVTAWDSLKEVNQEKPFS